MELLEQLFTRSRAPVRVGMVDRWLHVANSFGELVDARLAVFGLAGLSVVLRIPDFGLGIFPLSRLRIVLAGAILAGKVPGAISVAGDWHDQAVGLGEGEEARAVFLRLVAAILDPGWVIVVRHVAD